MPIEQHQRKTALAGLGAIDLACEPGAALVKRLAARADVLLGEHTEHVLAEWLEAGSGEIARLRAAGAFG